MPTINNIVLPANRCLVLPDEGSSTTGTLFRCSLQGFRRLVQGQPMPEDPDESPPPAIPYTKVLFVKEGCTEITVDGVEYQAMHQDNIVGVIPP